MVDSHPVLGILTVCDSTSRAGDVGVKPCSQRLCAPRGRLVHPFGSSEHTPAFPFVRMSFCATCRVLFAHLEFC